MSNKDKTPEKILLSMKIVSGRIKAKDLTDEQYKLLSCENMKPGRSEQHSGRHYTHGV
jgi:hypothetical protein